MLRKKINQWLTGYCIKNFPLQITTKTVEKKITTIYVKKGKIREWRSYDENHNRIKLNK